MRVRSPSSRASIRVRLSSCDVGIAAACPLFALYLHAAEFLLPFPAGAVLIYFVGSFVCSLIAFAAFGLRSGMPGHLSAHEVLDVAKAVLATEFMVGVMMFAVAPLDAIPRSVPVIHALALGSSLITTRLLGHLADKNRRLAKLPGGADIEHLVLIGMNDLSSLFMKFVEAFSPGSRVPIAVLEEDPRWTGRSLNGVKVYGPPAHLELLIDEFAIHGVSVDRVVVCGGSDTLSAEALQALRRVCARRGIELSFVTNPFNFASAMSAGSQTGATLEGASPRRSSPIVAPARYFRYKRIADTVFAAMLIVVLSPLWLIGAMAALIDVGSPVLFWQRRIGLGGRPFQIYKLRTLAHILDEAGRPMPDEARLSWIGRLLRSTRIDELPQLLSVLAGDMALIGPRPLLPRDQPADPSVRLMVRPGITGWAQVNGGALLSAEEKDALDAWYVRHATAWLDTCIIAMTLRSLFRGDRRSERALGQACRERDMLLANAPPASHPDTSTELAAAAIDAA